MRGVWEFCLLSKWLILFSYFFYFLFIYCMALRKAYCNNARCRCSWVFLKKISLICFFFSFCEVPANSGHVCVCMCVCVRVCACVCVCVCVCMTTWELNNQKKFLWALKCKKNAHGPKCTKTMGSPGFIRQMTDTGVAFLLLYCTLMSHSYSVVGHDRVTVMTFTSPPSLPLCRPWAGVSA